MAIEAAFSTGDVVPGAQISFARIRVRVKDLPGPGVYTVTTPYRQLKFTVETDPDKGENEINFTEDVGIAEGGVFTGALNGGIGPFLYCAGAPFAVGGGQYLAPSGGVCPNAALGGTFPARDLSSYEFRVQGPAGSPTPINVATTQFTIIGKIHADPIPTPLAVDKATYNRDANGMRLNLFATTQAIANRTVGGTAFPGRFALDGTLSTLQASGNGLPTQDLATNSPADGKFFASSDLFQAPETLPADVAVSNTADLPNTSKTVPLVDEVVIEKALYNPVTRVLSITAASSDKAEPPVLQVFMPGMAEALGTVANGGLNIEFPVVDSTVNPTKTYSIPPLNVTVRSSKGGSATLMVNVATPSAAAPPPTSPSLTVTVAGTGNGQVVSDPAGISCASGSCTGSFTGFVDLTATPSSLSVFGGWSGACTGTATVCRVAMEGSRTVTATFNPSPPANIEGTVYPSLQDAYDAAASGAVIKLLADTVSGTLDADRDVNVQIKGGYDAGYVFNQGISTISAPMTIVRGAIVADRIAIL